MIRGSILATGPIQYNQNEYKEADFVDDFKESLKEFRDEFYGKKEVKHFLKDDPEGTTFSYFVNLYWDTNFSSHQRLVKFLSLPNTIKWYDVIKAHPNEQYISFLQKSYSQEQSLKSLGEEYLFEKDEILALMLPIKLPGQVESCLHCNGLNLKRVKKDKNLYIRCFTDYFEV